jgi:hypothetical protein
MFKLQATISKQDIRAASNESAENLRRLEQQHPPPLTFFTSVRSSTFPFLFMQTARSGPGVSLTFLSSVVDKIEKKFGGERFNDPQ